MPTTAEPTKGVPRIEGNPRPTLRADHNALADWLRDNLEASVATVQALPSTFNWTGRRRKVIADGSTWEYQGSTLGWVRIALPWTVYTPTLAGVTLGTGATSRHLYRIANGEVHVFGTLKLGPSGSFGDVQVSLPLASGQTLPDIFPLGPITWVDDSQGGAGRYLGAAYVIGSSSAPNARLAQISTGGLTVVGPPFSSRDLDSVVYSIRYPL